MLHRTSIMFSHNDLSCRCLAEVEWTASSVHWRTNHSDGASAQTQRRRRVLYSHEIFQRRRRRFRDKPHASAFLLRRVSPRSRRSTLQSRHVEMALHDNRFHGPRGESTATCQVLHHSDESCFHDALQRHCPLATSRPGSRKYSERTSIRHARRVRQRSWIGATLLLLALGNASFGVASTEENAATKIKTGRFRQYLISDSQQLL